MCRYFWKGTCWYGPNCKYEHVTSWTPIYLESERPGRSQENWESQKPKEREAGRRVRQAKHPRAEELGEKHVQPRRKSLEEEEAGSSRIAGIDLVLLSTNVASRTSMISRVVGGGSKVEMILWGFRCS